MLDAQQRCVTALRIRALIYIFPTLLHRATARMAKLVDAWDLKSPARKGVPVRFRVRAPNKSRACMRFACRPFVFSPQKNRPLRNSVFYPFSVFLPKRASFSCANTKPSTRPGSGVITPDFQTGNQVLRVRKNSLSKPSTIGIAARNRRWPSSLSDTRFAR